MAFAFGKSTTSDKGQKKGPLGGWLGKKQPAAQREALPQINVAAGVDRALRPARPHADAQAAPTGEHPIHTALSAIEAALYVIDAVRDILEQASDVVLSAQEIKDAGGRALLAERYDELRLSIEAMIDKVDARAAQLVGRTAHNLDVGLGGKARYLVSLTRLDTGERGLNLPPPVHAFATLEEVDAILEKLDWALGRADRAAAGYCRDAQYLIARVKGAAGA